ncbi:VWA domain-containing protein [Calidithermus roseus]|uniref:VWFA-related Acidobacterial domain protein n=1 Tax=Calidithermus roseus TaxID=1644118 RepID=A0A399EX52_9DEIN|nr:VWA domain-containing protein [Calidithermus roseus]RIH89124.1 VWFA-related Acidobacterial domain protein [Calidithermus roseus]
MSFTWPALLLALVLLPVTALVLWGLERRRERTAQAFADAHLLGSVLRPASRAHRRWPLALQLLALGVLLFAAARPVALLPLPVNKAAVVLAIDTSRSMLASDLNPNRLEAARAIALEFVNLAPPSTQIGLTSFSDVATVLVPPTTDRERLREAISQLKIAQNTSLASAVVTGVRMLPGRKDVRPPEELTPRMFSLPDVQPSTPPTLQPEKMPPGAILIISDGVNNTSSNPEISASDGLRIATRFASQWKVRVYTVGVGREGGAIMQLNGQNYFVPFEPRTLQTLAQETDGKYTYAPSREALREVFAELGTVIRWEPTRTEVSALLSGVALILLVLAGALNLHWQRRVP